MAKNIKYQIPFGSKNTDYRIDIYAEYSGDTIKLIAGDTPIVTSGTNSENIETALRPSTGTIQVCTKLPADSAVTMGKEFITIEDILPSNNTSCPLVLSHRVGNNWVVDWQGFLSCEVYDQNYIGTPQNLELPIISVLEAMDSVKLKYEDINGYITIKTSIRTGLAKVTHEASFMLFDYVYFPEVNYQILNKYIDPSILIEMSVHDNENKVDYIENGNSHKTIIESVCKLMGWCAIEEGKNLYFMPINHNEGDSLRMVYQEYAHFHSYETFTPDGYSTLSDVNMSSFDYRGIGHKKSIYQGKTFVEIIAAIKKYDQKLDLPSFPRGELVQAPRDNDMYVCDNYNYSRFSIHRCLLMNWSLVENPGTLTGRKVTINKVGSYDMNMSYFRQSLYQQVNDIYTYYYNLFVYHTHGYDNFMYYASSFFAKWKAFGTWEGDVYTPGDDIEGLVLYGIPDRHLYTKGSWSGGGDIPTTYINTYKDVDDESIYIYKQVTPYVFFANTGKLKLTMNTKYYDYLCWYYYPDYQYSTPKSIRGEKVNIPFDELHPNINDERVKISIALQCGNKWYDGESWTTEYRRFWATFNSDGDCEMDINIDSQIRGNITIYFSPYMRGTFEKEVYNPDTQLMALAFFPVQTIMLTRLSIEYSPVEDITLNDASTNNYFRLLDTNFHDGLSIHTDIASFNLNRQSPSVIIDSYTDSEITFMKYLEYVMADGTLVERRPENDLLDRLAKWYSKIRRKVDLEISHPSNAPLPMTRIYADAENGYDGKHYIPISESRDWKSGVCTLTCLEDSDGDE